MGDAFTAFSLAGLFAMMPLIGESPSPVPMSTDPPLKEIGRVHATTPFCKTVLTHALAGIAVVLDNDIRIGEAEKTMRRVDADPSPIVRFSIWQELNREYAALRTAAVSGRASIRQLKGEAANAPTGDQKMALKKLANAIDGALARQNKVGDLVGRLAQYVDNHPPVDEAARERVHFEAAVAPEVRSTPTIVRPKIIIADSISAIANRDADEVHDLRTPLARDEDDAAARIDPAFSGC